MSDLRKAAQQALEFVTSEAWGKTPYMDVCVYEDAARLRDALRAALAQEQPEPAQEPVAWDGMSAQPEALRLADALDAWDGTLMMPAGWRQRTSAELRRQDKEIEALKTRAESAEANLCNTQIAWENWKVMHSTTRLEAEMQRKVRGE